MEIALLLVVLFLFSTSKTSPPVYTSNVPTTPAIVTNPPPPNLTPTVPTTQLPPGGWRNLPPGITISNKVFPPPPPPPKPGVPFSQIQIDRVNKAIAAQQTADPRLSQSVSRL